MQKIGLLLCMLSLLVLAACTNDTSDEQASENEQSSTNDITEFNESEDDNEATENIPPAALLIENATKLAEQQSAISGVVGFTQTDANGEIERFDSHYEMSDIDESFEDDSIQTAFYRSYIQQSLPNGEQFETYFSFGNSYYTYRDGEWFGNVIDETFDIGMHARLHYFTPYAWLHYLGPFLESVAPYEVYQTDYIVEADINEPALQAFFETNMYMLAEENSIYHYNDWSFVDEPAHIYFIFDKESHRLKEVGTSVKLLNAEYGEYTFDYVQQMDDVEGGSIQLPAEVIEATDISVW